MYLFFINYYRSSKVSWSKLGVNLDRLHLPIKIKTHEKTQIHINSKLNLKLLGKRDTCQQLSSEFHLSVQKCIEV